ncbi:hypothetical protein [Solirhodobacter olei]|uniref:hypothetical protein n=1 Tax=Solirhodobacter olei TaxID=2493082 RepID=UPI000FDAB760|nr:hypothetical protein [Solirhodobacter olei]
MPNVTFYFPISDMPPDDARARLTDACTALCIDPLKAALNNVHVLFVGVKHGRGHPVFAEIRYRQQPHRTPCVMAEFMEALDAAIRDTTGLTARVRCFGYGPAQIYARN